jgi:hypothetical protein
MLKIALEQSYIEIVFAADITSTIKTSATV